MKSENNYFNSKRKANICLRLVINSKDCGDKDQRQSISLFFSPEFLSIYREV